MASRTSGNITARGENRWLVRISLPADENGKRSWHSKTVQGTLKDARAYMTTKLHELDSGTYVRQTQTTQKRTLRQYMSEWVDTKKANARTIADYRGIIRRYVHDHPIGMMRVQDLRADHIRRFYIELQERGLAPRTVQYVHSVLHSALKRAVKDRLIARNPEEDARDVLEKVERSEKQVLTLEQARRFIAATSSDRYGALWLLLLETGLRPGEALGLKWSDLEGNVLRVQRALKEPASKGAEWRLERPKTKKAVRAVPITDRTLQALREHRKKQAEERLKIGEYWADGCEDGLMFTSSIGTYLRLSNLHRRSFKPLLEVAKLPPMRIYDLRHSSASLLLALGENPKVVQERLGHASITLTMDTYSHVLEGMQQQATDRLGAAFSEQLKVS
ncbi:MAG: site-specific integrase [Gemmatimonadetes bacterium]|nr:site-specific integrase [Gemmatimonadota bacterium]